MYNYIVSNNFLRALSTACGNKNVVMDRPVTWHVAISFTTARLHIITMKHDYRVVYSLGQKSMCLETSFQVH